MAEALFRTLHMVGLLGLAAGLVIVALGTRPQMPKDDAAGMGKIYLLILLSLLITFAAGLTLYLWVGKPAAFFSNNPVFHAKMGLFMLLVLCIVPALLFFLTRKPERAEMVDVPAAIRHLQKLSLPVLLVMPVLAYLMARGVGY